MSSAGADGRPGGLERAVNGLCPGRRVLVRRPRSPLRGYSAGVVRQERRLRCPKRNMRCPPPDPPVFPVFKPFLRHHRGSEGAPKGLRWGPRAVPPDRAGGEPQPVSAQRSRAAAGGPSRPYPAGRGSRRQREASGLERRRSPAVPGSACPRLPARGPPLRGYSASVVRQALSRWCLKERCRYSRLRTDETRRTHLAINLYVFFYMLGFHRQWCP
jgi:hypothetical protein